MPAVWLLSYMEPAVIPRWRLVLKRRKAMTKKNENNSGSLVLVDAELLSQG